MSTIRAYLRTLSLAFVIAIATSDEFEELIKKAENAKPLENLNSEKGRVNVVMLGFWIDATTDYGERMAVRTQIEGRYRNMFAGLTYLIKTVQGKEAPVSEIQDFTTDITSLKKLCDTEVRKMLKIAGIQEHSGNFAFLLEIVLELVFVNGTGFQRLDVLLRYIITACARTEKDISIIYAKIKEELAHRLKCWVKQLAPILYSHTHGGRQATSDLSVAALEIINSLRSLDSSHPVKFWY